VSEYPVKIRELARQPSISGLFFMFLARLIAVKKALRYNAIKSPIDERSRFAVEWEKADQNLGAYLDGLLINYACKKKPMFGAPVYFVNDNMWTGVKGGKLFLRLPEDDQLRIRSENGEIKPFEPRPDFFMREYVEIPPSALSGVDFMRRWLDRSYAFVQCLPPKIKADKKAKKAKPEKA
jgi:TfoX/Sxy family transcriptional regulator of competence genes